MKYNFFEILGLAGSGKSTVVGALKKEKNNYKYKYGDIRLNVYIMRYLYSYFRVYIKSKNMIFVKSFILFHIVLYHAKKGNISKKDIYVFDQGPIFILCMLIHEVPSMQSFFLLELEKILPYYKSIIYLEAPLDILCSRIEKREQNHRIKNIEQEKQIFFLKSYREIYDSVVNRCEQHNIQVIRIDTNQKSIYEVKEKINEVIQKKQH